MKLNADVIDYMDRSVLCWLATASLEGMPNVSPKEIFNHYGSDRIIVANIASPQTVRNIKQNENVCISFVEIFIQKGFQVKGTARIIAKKDAEFSVMELVLTEMTNGKFPFASITEITVREVKPIIAPKYWLYPETTEEEQIKSARELYRV